jgi:hypothetical protein
MLTHATMTENPLELSSSHTPPSYLWHHLAISLRLADEETNMHHLLLSGLALTVFLAASACYLLKPSIKKPIHNDEIRQLHYEEILNAKQTKITTNHIFALLVINILFASASSNANDTAGWEHQRDNAQIKVIAGLFNTFLQLNLLALLEKTIPSPQTNLMNSMTFWVWAGERGNLQKLTNEQIYALPEPVLERIIHNPETAPHDQRFTSAYQTKHG